MFENKDKIKLEHLKELRHAKNLCKQEKDLKEVCELNGVDYLGF